MRSMNIKEGFVPDKKIAGRDMPKDTVDMLHNLPGYELATSEMEKRLKELEAEKAVLLVSLKDAEVDLEVQKSVKGDVKETTKFVKKIQEEIERVNSELEILSEAIENGSPDWEVKN